MVRTALGLVPPERMDCSIRPDWLGRPGGRGGDPILCHLICFCHANPRQRASGWGEAPTSYNESKCMLFEPEQKELSGGQGG